MWIQDPVSGMVKRRIRDKHPGSLHWNIINFLGRGVFNIRFQPKYRPLRSVFWIRIRIRINLITWIRIQIRIKVMSWIRNRILIFIDLQMTSQNILNMSLF
jgi:hypothetical protein